PSVAWSLLAEYAATIRTDAAGLTYQTLGGVLLPYRWDQVRALPPPAPDPPENAAAESLPPPDTVIPLAVDPPALERIPRPLVRRLQQQAYAGRVPLYPGLADRPTLLAEIARRTRDQGSGVGGRDEF
ncbi:MAG TPA: hypothetical protein VKY74_18615, partial [Chloroflexia bacterium]|nr:hypothetical protein [Chloroflexia bacterium]